MMMTRSHVKSVLSFHNNDRCANVQLTNHWKSTAHKGDNPNKRMTSEARGQIPEKLPVSLITGVYFLM